MRALLIILVASCGSPKQSPPQNTSNNASKLQPLPDTVNGKVVERSKHGGVIELAGDRGASMEWANQQMAAHCGDAMYTITQEGEEAVDDKQPATVEWRVHYACNGN